MNIFTWKRINQIDTDQNYNTKTQFNIDETPHFYENLVKKLLI